MEREEALRLYEENEKLVFFILNKYYPTHAFDEDAVQELCQGQAPTSTVLFGLLILMPYIHRVYKEEAGLIEELLG